MKPGERIRLITECATSLDTKPWAEVQLTLDQFGFETYNTSNWEDSERHQYLIDRIKDGSDGEIFTLHEYCLGADAAPITRTSDAPWGPLPVYVFLSHIHPHRAFVGEVKRLLARWGVDAFVAHDDIDASQSWRDVIKAALATCHVFVACLHDGFHQSQWCDQEVGWALARNIPILPVRLGAERHDGFLADFQDQPWTDSAWVMAERVFDVVVADQRTHPQGVRAVVEAFVNSWSFDMTRKLLGLLEAEPHLEPEQLRRLEYAVQTNRQIYDAVAGPKGTPVPDLVAALVLKHEPPPPPDPWAQEPPF